MPETQEITQEQFDAFIDTRDSGLFNMFDTIEAASYAGLDTGTYKYILLNFDKLEKEFGDPNS